MWLVSTRQQSTWLDPRTVTENKLHLFFRPTLSHSCIHLHLYNISKAYIYTHTKPFLKESNLQSIRFHKWIFWMKSSGAYTHAHTRCSDQYKSLSRIINFHCNTINFSVNPAFWSSMVKSMKSLINPELTLIQTPLFLQLHCSLIA